MSSMHFNTQRSSRSLKFLIIFTCICSLLSPFLSFILSHFSLLGPQDFFPLSLQGIERGFVWQFISYFFINSLGSSITLSLLMSCFFLMVLLWFSGKEILSHFGDWSFFALYFLAGILGGAVGLLGFLAFPSSIPLVGSKTPVFAMVTAWLMLYPNLELIFIFFWRIKAKWLVLILFGLSLFVDLIYGQFVYFLSSLTGILVGFLFTKFLWKLTWPFSKPIKKRARREDKIIDITETWEDDDAFMDRCLEKIAKEGSSSLTESEKRRMEAISKRKRNT